MRQLIEEIVQTPPSGLNNSMDEDTLFLELYRSHRKKIIDWGKKNSTLNEQDLEDVFQDSLIIIYKKLDLIPSRDKLVGFLWTTFKFKLQHKYRDRIKFKLDGEIDDHFLKARDNKIYEKMDNDHLKFLLKKSLEFLGEPCKTLLRLLIYKRYAPDAVAKNMGYSNVNVVYTKTNLCLKRLRQQTADKL